MAQFEIKDGIAIIPEGTTEIGVRAFENSDVRRVVIPDSVKQIGVRAFENSDVRHVVIPDSVEKIDNLAFYRCKSLESVTLPKGLKTIPYSCFDECISLQELLDLVNP